MSAQVVSIDWMNFVRAHRILRWLTLFLAIGLGNDANAVTFTLKNGMEVSGTLIKLANIGNPLFAGGGNAGVKPIFMLDDGLRRTYFSTYQKQALREDVESLETIRLRQSVARGNRGKLVGAVGRFFKSPTPFDEFGRRTVYLMTPHGKTEVIQGITEINPLYTRVEGLQTDRSFVWDMRLATSSIPRSTLSRILKTHLDKDNVDDRLSIVRLYLQSQRYGDAEEELRTAIEDFPQLKNLDIQLQELHQLHAEQRLEEIKIRKAAGQHNLAHTFLQNFPERDVAGELLLEVRELISEHEQQKSNADRAFEMITEQLAEQPEGARKEKLIEFRTELESDLGWDTVNRLVSYLRLADDSEMTSEQKLSLALSRWLLATDGTDNMAVALSLLRTRDLVRRYLTTDDPAERTSILVSLRSEEAGSAEYVSKLIAAMRPVADATRTPSTGRQEDEQLDEDAEPNQEDESAQSSIPGLFEFTVPGLREGESIRYVAQVPPEYHSYRSYPAIVTLHGASSTPERQVDWWMGNYNTELQMHTGQAARKGYIVIAPAWTVEERQRKYKYSALEHAAVLTSLRDAMRRFSIDSDRVYLSGHSLGGDAAWDIGLAHPDLWAGLIPIAATAAYHADAPKYVSQYWKNGRLLPSYFIAGALDVARIAGNSTDFDRYLKYNDFDTMIVEYRGRGHEHFQDEIHRIFEWMALHKRNFSPREFEANSLRPWDNFFWWVEFHGMPQRSVAMPLADWPKGTRPMKLSATAREKQTLAVRSGADQTTLWLSPDLVDLDQRITVKWNGKSKTHEISPDVQVMLEDVRLRADRQHPFWAKIEVGAKRKR
jgi:pimeloyl-ACP methyl ester carboxylesterase/tetratricopeptide (TPR) repeat protein